MLELRPNCECCDRDLPPESELARICTFECTFCADCAENVFGGRLPQLWRRFHAAAGASGGVARKAPGIDGARDEAAPRVRQVRA